MPIKSGPQYVGGRPRIYGHTPSHIGDDSLIVELVSGKDSEALTKLEMEYELQKQIVKAKLKLSNDETISKNIRKKHKEGYVKAHAKVSWSLVTVFPGCGLLRGVTC